MDSSKTDKQDINKKHKVSLITLCYNQLESATKPFLESLYKYTDSDLFELIIVNNASTDGTKDYIEEFGKSHSNVKIINNDENLGYAKGNNKGLEIANGEYLFLLNNDLLFTPKWLEKAVNILKNNNEIGLLGFKTNFCGSPLQVINNADKITIKNYIEETNNLNGESVTYVNNGRIIFFCIGLSRNTFEKVGYLDENYGKCWFEDDDYTLRVIYEGLKIAIANDIFIYHNHSQTTSSFAKTKEGKELFEKNRLYFENKHKLYLTLKQHANESAGEDYEKLKRKYSKYKKFFNVMLPALIIETILILIFTFLLIINFSI